MEYLNKIFNTIEKHNQKMIAFEFGTCGNICNMLDKSKNFIGGYVANNDDFIKNEFGISFLNLNDKIDEIVYEINKKQHAELVISSIIKDEKIYCNLYFLDKKYSFENTLNKDDKKYEATTKCIVFLSDILERFNK